jgi:4-hydroxybenzoate polyprenyltransferase
MNDFADRNFDAHVKRTRDRPLATGELDPIEALALCVSLGLVAIGLVLTMNSLTQLMAYAAHTGEYPPRMAWLLFIAGLLWTMAYDTMYAMVDREDDKKLGIRSSAILFGDADRFIIGIMQLMSLYALWLAGRELELGLWFGLGLIMAAIFALYQQYLIRERKPEDCFKAFINNNYFGMAIFIGIALEYTFR